jgi:hypothetical protein
MALRWIEGFETFGNTNDGPAVWGETFYGKYGSANMDSSYPKLIEGYRGMGLGLDVDNLSYNYFRVPLDQQQTLIVGFAFKIPNGVYYYGENIVKLADGATSQLWLEVQRDSPHQILLFRDQTVVDSLGYYDPNEWVYIEIKVTFGNTGSYECRVRGVTVCSGTNVDTSSTGNSYADSVWFGWNTGAYDDIYILDGQSGLNDFLGEMKVEKGMPTNDSSTQWSRSSGSNNYGIIDEVPVTSSDYLYSKTQNDTDLFGVAPVGSTRVKGAQMNVETKLSVPGGKELVLLCDSSGSQQSEAHQIGEADDRVGAALITELDPNTSLAWTQAGINAAKWGVKVG